MPPTEHVSLEALVGRNKDAILDVADGLEEVAAAVAKMQIAEERERESPVWRAAIQALAVLAAFASFVMHFIGG